MSMVNSNSLETSKAQDLYNNFLGIVLKSIIFLFITLTWNPYTFSSRCKTKSERLVTLVCPVGSQLLCQGRPSGTTFQDSFISFNFVVLRAFCQLRIQRNLEANKYISAKNCIIYETPPRLLASHTSLGSNQWLKRLISQKIKVFTGK